MSILQQNYTDVKNKADVFTLAEKDRATVGTDLSVSASSAGARTSAFIMPSDKGSNLLHSLTDTFVESLSDKPNTSIRDNVPYLDNLTNDVSDSVPAGLDDLEDINCDTSDFTGVQKDCGLSYPQHDLDQICMDFDNHLFKLSHTPGIFLHCRNETDLSEALIKVSPTSGSRYFPDGRARIKRKIKSRLKPEKQAGVFLVNTVDTKRYSLVEAWCMLWERHKAFMDALNIYRRRHMNTTRRLTYIAVLEQHESGYPHLNIFFPSLRVLIKKADIGKLNEWWGMGSVNIEKERRTESAQSYVLKYISKMKGWDPRCFAILWYFKIRMWNMSHCMYGDHRSSGWVLITFYKNEKELSKGLDILIVEARAIIESGISFIVIHSP